MEGRVMGWCILALGMLRFAARAIVSSYDIACAQALTDVLPCHTYLDGSGAATPSAECCVGVQKVLSEATSTSIRRYLCQCFKQAAVALGVDASRAQSIPQHCHVSLPAPLDPNIDCSAVPS